MLDFIYSDANIVIHNFIGIKRKFLHHIRLMIYALKKTVFLV